MMAWINFSRLSHVFECFRTTLYFLLRWVPPVFRTFITYTSTAIAWLSDRGRTGDEFETGENDPEFLPDEVREESGRTNEAVVVERAAGLDRKPVFEEEEDEFDSDEYRVETTDKFYCEYDSSWETEESQTGPYKCTWRPGAPKSFKFRRFENAAKDTWNYRHDYPSQTRWQRWDEADAKPNLDFYLGVKPSLPDGIYINDFHDEWAGQYDKLECVHTFIQWLFPLPEPGMNYEATPLTREEIDGFCESSTAKENLLKSYKLMLDFYGIKLRNKATGEVERAANWRERFDNLNRHTHNSLRITRILKCLGILGFPNYQYPLVRFFLEQTLIHGELPNVQDSALSYFMFSVRNKRQRRRLIKFAYMNYKREDEFVWCPKKIQMKWSLHVESGPQRRMVGLYESEQQR